MFQKLTCLCSCQDGMPVKTLSTIELPDNTVRVEDSPVPARRYYSRRTISAESTLNSVRVNISVYIKTRNDGNDINALINSSQFVLVAYVHDCILFLRCNGYYCIFHSIIYIPFTFTYYIVIPNNQNILLYVHPYHYAKYVKLNKHVQFI